MKTNNKKSASHWMYKGVLCPPVFQEEKLHLNHEVMRRESSRLSASSPALTRVKEQPASPLILVACGLHPPSAVPAQEDKGLRRNGLLKPGEGFLTDLRHFHAEQEVNCRVEADRREVF